MDKQQPNKFKILMFPWLAHGHINPFVELAKRLPSATFTIYLCSTRVNLDSLKPRILKEFSTPIELLELHVPASPELPPEMHNTKNLSTSHINALIAAFQMSGPSFSEILSSVKPDLLIYDYFQPWAARLAASKGIPSVLFTISGATTLAFNHHSHTMGNDSPFPFPAIHLLEVEKLERSHVLKGFKVDMGEDFSFGNFELSTDIVLVKTSREVEAKYLDYLSVFCDKRIVPTGSLFVDAADDGEEHSEIMEWLSGKKESSTVYISFGSECFLSKEEMAELAKGLLLLLSDEVNFLWVVRFPNGGTTTSVEEALPEGFLETVKGRGRVIEKWAPQTKILAHPSIGGFVSHCGWSSMTESMYFGVPIIGMPIKTDQPLNARFAAEVGVGVVVEKDEGGRFKGVEVARAMRRVMVEKEFSEGVRDRAKRLRQRIRENSDEERDALAGELLSLCMKKISM